MTLLGYLTLSLPPVPEPREELSADVEDREGHCHHRRTRRWHGFKVECVDCGRIWEPDYEDEPEEDYDEFWKSRRNEP